MISVSLDSKQYAALAGALIFYQCLLDYRTWTCRFCGYIENRIASEVCVKCDREDCSQGSEP